MTYLQDRSNDIKDMLNDLQNSLIFAILLVMIVIIGALGLRGGCWWAWPSPPPS